METREKQIFQLNVRNNILTFRLSKDKNGLSWEEESYSSLDVAKHKLDDFLPKYLEKSRASHGQLD